MATSKVKYLSTILKVLRWEVGQTLTLFVVSIYRTTIFSKKVKHKYCYIFSDSDVVILI